MRGLKQGLRQLEHRGVGRTLMSAWIETGNITLDLPMELDRRTLMSAWIETTRLAPTPTNNRSRTLMSAWIETASILSRRPSSSVALS